MSDDMTCQIDPKDEPQVVERSPKGRFVRFNQKLGSGSYKTVYLGFDNDTGREVAWNVITFKHMSKHERKRIREEIDIVKSLNHHRIMTFINTWINKQEEEVVFISERVTGGSLRTYINRLGAPLKIKVVRDWSRQILEGLHYLHTVEPNPVIHRDLKCDNIFINSHVGEILIGDLGLSTILTQSCAASVVGTPEFMAPEYYDEKYGTSVDIYAFGMCLLEMVVRTSPYAECSTLGQVYKKVIAGEKPLALSRIKDQQLQNIVIRCLETRADDRPTADQLLLDEFLVSQDGGDRLCELWREDELLPRLPTETKEDPPKQIPGEVVHANERGCVSGSGEARGQMPTIDENKQQLHELLRTPNRIIEQSKDWHNSNRAAFHSTIAKLDNQVVVSVSLLVQKEDRTFHRVVFDYDTVQDSPQLVAAEMIEGCIVPPTIVLQDLINRIEEAVTLRAHELSQDIEGLEPLANGDASSPHPTVCHDEVPVINFSGPSCQDAIPFVGHYMGPCEVQTVILQPGLQQVAVQTVLLTHDASPIEIPMVQMKRDPNPFASTEQGLDASDYILATAVPNSQPQPLTGTVVSGPSFSGAFRRDGDETMFEDQQFTRPIMRQRSRLQRGECAPEMSVQVEDIQRCLNFLGASVNMKDLVLGQFCLATEEAIVSFQKLHSQAPTGVVDEEFWEVLFVCVQQKQEAMQVNRDLAKKKSTMEKEKKKEQQAVESAMQLENMMSTCFQSLGSKTSEKSNELHKIAHTSSVPSVPIISSTDGGETSGDATSATHRIASPKAVGLLSSAPPNAPMASSAVCAPASTRLNAVQDGAASTLPAGVPTLPVGTPSSPHPVVAATVIASVTTLPACSPAATSTATVGAPSSVAPIAAPTPTISQPLYQGAMSLTPTAMHISTSQETAPAPLMPASEPFTTAAPLAPPPSVAPAVSSSSVPAVAPFCEIFPASSLLSDIAESRKNHLDPTACVLLPDVTLHGDVSRGAPEHRSVLSRRQSPASDRSSRPLASAGNLDTSQGYDTAG